MAKSSVVLLFDIDGTLIHSAGAGGAALRRALQEEFAINNALSIPLHGRTDLGILTELLELHELPSSSENYSRFVARYFEVLPHALESHRQHSQVLPGVRELLDAVAGDERFIVGLLTGNLPFSAQVKLQYFSLWDYFEFGIYGDLAAHRPHLAMPARERVAEHCGYEVASTSVVVIGDTPLDVELAKAMGSRCLAVCTGGIEADELCAAGADLVLPALTETNRIVNWFLELAPVAETAD